MGEEFNKIVKYEGAFRIVDLFYCLSFFPFLNGVKGQRLCGLHSVDAQPGITPALGPVAAGRAPNSPLYPASPSTPPPVPVPNAVCDQV